MLLYVNKLPVTAIVINAIQVRTEYISANLVNFHNVDGAHHLQVVKCFIYQRQQNQSVCRAEMDYESEKILRVIFPDGIPGNRNTLKGFLFHFNIFSLFRTPPK